MKVTHVQAHLPECHIKPVRNIYISVVRAPEALPWTRPYYHQLEGTSGLQSFDQWKPNTLRFLLVVQVRQYKCSLRTENRLHIVPLKDNWIYREHNNISVQCVFFFSAQSPNVLYSTWWDDTWLTVTGEHNVITFLANFAMARPNTTTDMTSLNIKKKVHFERYKLLKWMWTRC